MKKKILGFAILYGLMNASLHSQILWEENFESYSVNPITGVIGIDGVPLGDYPDNVPFTIDASETSFNDTSFDHIRISNAELVARDLDGDAIITFNPVGISNQTGDVTITIGLVHFDIVTSDDVATSWSGGDYIDILYSLDDGQTFERFPNHNGQGDNDHTFVVPEGLAPHEDIISAFSEQIDPGTATSVTLQIIANNNGTNERFEFDDIDISRNAVSLWSEDFSTYVDHSGITGLGSEVFSNSGDYPDGVTKWTLTLNNENQLSSSNDFAGVTGSSENGTHVFKLEDSNDPITFETQAIDIMGQSEITFGFDINFDETNYEADDFIDVFYSIDEGATYTLVQDDGTGHTYGGALITANYNTAETRNTQLVETLSGLSATSLILQIVYSNNSSAEDYEIDNMSVVVGDNLSTHSSLNKLDLVHVYPNPIKEGLLKIRLSNSNASSIAFFDLAGRKIFNHKTHGKSIIQINTGHFKNGVYLVEISQDNNRISKKIVVQ